MLRQLELEQVRAGDHHRSGYGPNNAYTVVGNQFLPWPQAGSSPPGTYDYNQFEYLQREDNATRPASWRMTTSVITSSRT